MKSIVIDSIEEMEQYKEDWDELRLESRASVYSSFDLTRLWLDSYKETFNPRIVIVEDRGQLLGVAPLCVFKYSLAGLPIRNLILVGHNTKFVMYSLGTVMARHDDKEIIDKMVKAIGGFRWNLMEMSFIDPLPASLRFLDLINEGFGCQTNPETVNYCYEFPSEGEIGARFASRTRRELRKSLHGLEKDGRLQFRKVRSVDEAEASMHSHVSMHIDRWAKKGGSIYLDPRNAHQMMEIGKLAVGKEMGAIHELLIDGEVAAQVICIYDGEVVRGMRQGISEKFLEYSPGKLAIMMCMETLRAEGFKRMDLGHGDEPYKSHMKTSECSLPSFQVERGGLRAMRKVRSFPPIRQMDQRFQLSDRMLGRNRSHLSCTTDASRSPKVVQVNEST